MSCREPNEYVSLFRTRRRPARPRLKLVQQAPLIVALWRPSRCDDRDERSLSFGHARRALLQAFPACRPLTAWRLQITATRTFAVWDGERRDGT